MYWADEFAQQIIKSGKHQPYWVDDMKTPSGRVHVGALRGVIIHDLLFKALKKQGVNKASHTYVINDMDPMDGFPHYLPEEFKEHMGKPLFQIPSPEKGYQSMARCYGEQFIKVFNQLGAQPKIIWSSDWYQQGKFNQVIKEVLDKVGEVRKLYKKVSGYDKPANWYPFQVICPQCGKVGTTIVTDWDGEQVTFECQKDLVKWAQGCGYKGKTSPLNGTGKLMWKVDWAAHWRVIGVSIEWAGKDHMTEGGSYDLSAAICDKVLNYPAPHARLYEWFLARGGSKMSSSRGIGVSAAEISQTLPSTILRFLLTKSNYKKAIIFDPNNNQSILDLFDNYDIYAQAYWQKTDQQKARVFELSQVGETPELHFLPRFREIVRVIQDPKFNIEQYFEKVKGSALTKKEQTVLKERIKYAQIWIKTYAPEKMVYGLTEKLPEAVRKFSAEQKDYLREVAKLLEKDWPKPEKLQQALYDQSKKMGLTANKAFGAIYLALLGKTHGPQAAWFLLEEDKERIIERLKSAASQATIKSKKQYLYPTIDDPAVLSIDLNFAKKYPSVNVGLAIIKGVRVQKSSPELQKEINDFLQKASGLTTEEISQYPEIQSYRRIYKETGVDWHSRRPSPESLLRRIALKKGLYSINTCVDAYNLVVMKHRVSAGAFDLDQIKFPTVLRFAKKGEKIHLLGDKEPTEYKPGEVAYFDQKGGFNIDFNYKDAQRTLITEKTQNLWINLDGVYEITREQIERSLKEVIEKIIKYCGGKVELAGIVPASK